MADNQTFPFESNATSYLEIFNPDEPIPVGVLSDDYYSDEDVYRLPSQCTTTLTEDYLFQVRGCNFWSGVLILVFGIFAIFCNMISIHVFTRKDMRNGFNSLIVVLTVVDTLLCTCIIAEFSLVRAFDLNTVGYTMIYPMVIYPFSNMVMVGSIYMTVVLGLERYIAVCHPIRHRAMVHSHCITKRVCFYTGPVVVLSLLINVTKFLETKVVTQQSNIQEANGSNVSITTYKIDITELRNNPVYIKYYMNVIRTIMLGILPFSALIFFNIKIYRRFLRTRARYQRENNNSSQAKDLQLAYILVFIICVFIGTNLPRLLVNLYELFTVDYTLKCGIHYLPPAWFICSSDLTHLLMVINGICNFLIYCWLNPSFKSVLYKTILTREGRGGRVGSNNNQTNNINNNEVTENPCANRTMRLTSLATSTISVDPSRRGTAVIIHSEQATPVPKPPKERVLKVGRVVASATLKVSESMSTLSTASVQKLSRSKSEHGLEGKIHFQLVVTSSASQIVNKPGGEISHKDEESISDCSIQSNCNSMKSLMPIQQSTSFIRYTRV